VMEEVRESYGDALLPVHIGISSSLAKAQHDGRDIFAFDRVSRGARQYKELAGYLDEQLV